MPRGAFWVSPFSRIHVAAALAALFGALVVVAAVMAFFSAFIWPVTDIGEPDRRVNAGAIEDFDVLEPVYFEEGHFWLIRLPDDSFIALSATNPAQGCTLPWRPTFSFTDPATGITSEGWFRDPCWGATFDINGTRVFGPSPRDMDRYPVAIEGQRVIVQASEGDLILGHSALD